MTRGKYAAKAAVRKEVTERDQQIDSYQHNIKKLSAENAELRQRITDMQASHSKTVRVLKVERDEGLSPQLAVLQKENERLKERRDRAEAELKKIKQLWDGVYKVMHRHFMDEHRMTGLDATEAVLAITPDVDGNTKRLTIVDEPTLMKLDHKSPGAARAIQRARGERQ